MSRLTPRPVHITNGLERQQMLRWLIEEQGGPSAVAKMSGVHRVTLHQLMTGERNLLTARPANPTPAARAGPHGRRRHSPPGDPARTAGPLGAHHAAPGGRHRGAAGPSIGGGVSSPERSFAAGSPGAEGRDRGVPLTETVPDGARRGHPAPGGGAGAAGEHSGELTVCRWRSCITTTVAHVRPSGPSSLSSPPGRLLHTRSHRSRRLPVTLRAQGA